MATDNYTDIMGRRFHRFVQRLRADDANGAGEEFARLCHWLRSSELKLSSRTIAAFMEAWIDLFWQCRCHELMLKAAVQAEELIGRDPEWAFARGEALFNLGRFDEARQALEPLTTEDFEEPMLYYLLACLAERRGDDEQAQRLFQTAHRLDPASFHLPLSISEKEAIRQYRQCLEELPEILATQVNALPILVHPLPPDELFQPAEGTVDPLILGLFQGQPLGAGHSSWPTDQPCVLLFHKNIAKVANDFDTLEDELRKTLFHEIGHYLGYDEDQLEEMGLA